VGTATILFRGTTREFPFVKVVEARGWRAKRVVPRRLPTCHATYLSERERRLLGSLVFFGPLTAKASYNASLIVRSSGCRSTAREY
jgi:hypothetical protein